MATSPSATPTPITPPRVAVVDPRTGLISREWYLFFLSLFRTSEGIITADTSAPTTASMVASLEAAVGSVEQDIQLQPTPIATTPAGSTGQIQYNSGFSFAASPLLTYDGVGTLGTSNITGTALGMSIQPKAPTVLEDALDLALYGRNAVKTNSIGGGIVLTTGLGLGSGAGGDISLFAAQGGTTGDGGNFTIYSGQGVNGGSLQIAAGQSLTTTGAGGALIVAAGAGFDGGPMAFLAGSNNVAGGTGGSLIFYAGDAVVGSAAGNVDFLTQGSGNAADAQGSIRMLVLGGTVTGLEVTDNAVAAQLGFYGVTPVIRPTTATPTVARVAVAGGNAVDDNDTFGGYTIGQIVNALKAVGILT